MNNKVELLGFYGSDLTHAQSAWTSTIRDLDEDKLSRVDKLLKSLAEAGHETPFEKSSLHFLVDTDIASHIHIIKHRIAVSVNGESARYKELKEDKYYLPEDWKGVINSKEVYYDDTITRSHIPENSDNWYDILDSFTKLGNFLYHEALSDLTLNLGRKRAKESARYFKGYNSQMTADVMFNWRSFYHFQTLRNDDHAQKEINEVAKEMLRLVKEIPGNPFKHTIEAFKLENK